MAMLSTALTGCVSAVDETSAFGFSSQPKPAAEADVAEAPADAEPEAGSEVAEAAVLCPSFYRADIIYNPSAVDRLLAGVRAAVIGFLQRRRAGRRIALA